MAYPQTTFRQTTFFGPGLISGRRDVVLRNTLLYQLQVLKETGRYDAFKLNWHPSYDDPPGVWPIPNHLFWESDIAKWIEGACYFLEWQHHTDIDDAVQELVEMIRGAQQPDGYINIHYTVVQPGKRFTSLRDFHELYNAGHLIEAALAHQQLYGNDRFLAPIMKYADLLCQLFGANDDQSHGYPGHPEIELALLRLYERTGRHRYLELAQYFITERGNPSGVAGRHFYVVEAERRGDSPHARPAFHTEEGGMLWYYQAHKPLVEQNTIEGHAVRAMYLLTAAADLTRIKSATQEPRDGLFEAILRLWNNVINQKMYVTGGIGAIRAYEGFGPNYFLPQGADEGGCYAETCAGIGLMMLAERLVQIDLNAEYTDVMELCFYNAVLTGMSSDGRRFTYANQLTSSVGDLSKREEWFTCSCCPPNMTRLLGSVGGYLWSVKSGDNHENKTINVHMFSSAVLEFNLAGVACTLKQKTNWPWEGKVDFELDAPSKRIALNIRIPRWAFTWRIEPTLPEAKMKNGYLHIPVEWLQLNNKFQFIIPLTLRALSPHPFTNQDTVSFARGPVIYCAEGIDNPWVSDHFKSILIDPKRTEVEESAIGEHQHGEPGVCLTLRGGIAGFDSSVKQPISSTMPYEELDSSITPLHTQELHLIPYYYRANRGGSGQMRVGFRRWHSNT